MGRNGSGVKKASKSSIEISFTYNGHRCRERIKCQPTPANLRRLEVFRDEIIDAIELGIFDYATSFPESQIAKKPTEIDNTVSHWLDKMLDRKQASIKATTYRNYRQNIVILKPIFGNLKIDEIKRRHVRDYCETLQTGNRRIQELILPLKAALECAVDDEVIENNPLRDFSFRRVEAPKADHVDPLSRQEAEILLNSIDGPFKNLVQFAIWTGLRSSELCALEWGDIDFIRSVVKIQRAKTQAAHKPETPKTRTGTREVKLLAPSLAALANQKQHSFLAGKQIFLNNQNKPYTGDYQIWVNWQRALLKAGIRYRNPYQTRHTYASWMLSAGESLPWIAQQMGHSSVMITTQHYARFIPDEKQDLGAKAVSLFSP